MTKPLYEMTKKDMKWNWKERQQRVLKKLKERFMTEPVLITPDLDKKIRVETDVSDFTTDGVFFMKCEDEK